MDASRPNAGEAEKDLLDALCGGDTSRECQVAMRTRRIVSASRGVIREQQAGRKRIRSLALAAMLVILLVLGPLIWWIVESMLDGESLSGTAMQCAVLGVLLGAGLLAAALLAGWLRRRR